MRANGRTQPGSTLRRGFSLMEMLLVIAIIGLIAALVLPRLGKAFGKGQVKTTEAQLSSLSAAVVQFRTDVGRLPTAEEGLGVLITKPDGVDGWDGPYIEKRSLPTDGWKNPFVYKLDEAFGFEILSYGADGREGGEGDDTDLSNRT